MDTLTHALSGALIARATAPGRAQAGALPLRRRIFAGFLAAAFPDLDVVVSQLSPTAYLEYHRGVTHSLLMLPLWALALSWMCALLWRGQPGWRAWFGVIAWGIGIHIAGDWITSFGTMLFAPLSHARYALSTTFIIDPWFTGILLAGLAAAFVWRRSRVPALLGLGVLAAYVVFQFALQQQAIGFGERHARAAGLGQARVTAQPRPVSPFNWMVVVGDDSGYHYSLVNLVRHEPARLAPDAGYFARLTAPYLPLDQAVWMRAARFGYAPEQVALAKEVWQQPQFGFFRRFAAYPALYRIDAGNPSVCVWFQDLRFFTPGRSAWPFRYGMCREAGGSWKPFELLDEKERLPVD